MQPTGQGAERPYPPMHASVLDVVGDRWALLAVREVSLGAHRFSEIVRGTGAPRDRITVRLNALVDAGVLERRQYSDAPPRSDYHLTQAGRELLPVLQSLLQWGDRWVAKRPPVELRHDGHRIDPAWQCRTCGKPTTGPDVERVVTHDDDPSYQPRRG